MFIFGLFIFIFVFMAIMFVFLHNRGRCDTFRSRLDHFETRFKPKIDPFGTRKVTPGPHRSPRGTQEGAGSAPEGPNLENQRHLLGFEWFSSPWAPPSYVPRGQV